MGSDYLLVIEMPNGEWSVRSVGAIAEDAQREFDKARRDGPHVRLVRIVSEQFNPRTMP